MDNLKWQPATSPVDHGQIVPVGDIGIFIGYVGAGSEEEAGNTEQVGDNLDNDSEAYANSIHPVIDEEAYYSSDYNSISSGFTEPAGVYMADGDANTQDPFSTLISADNAAARAAELEATRVALAKVAKTLEEKQRLTMASEIHLENKRKELESIGEYNKQRSLPRHPSPESLHGWRCGPREPTRHLNHSSNRSYGSRIDT
jgi:hypothetical protein